MALCLSLPPRLPLAQLRMKSFARANKEAVCAPRELFRGELTFLGAFLWRAETSAGAFAYFNYDCFLIALSRGAFFPARSLL